MEPHALVAALLAALLASIPALPAKIARRFASAREDIINVGVEAEVEDGVPAGLAIVIGLLESHWGLDAGEGGAWGCPRDRFHRNQAGTPAQAIRVLARGFDRCRSWGRATVFFRTGQCSFPRRLVGYEPSDAMRLATRVYQRAGVPLPDRW